VQDDGFIDDDDADQIEPGYIVRRVKKKDFSGEELEGWDHYPSVEYVQVLPNCYSCREEGFLFDRRTCSQDEMLKRAVQETITFIFAKENEEPGAAEATVPVEEEAVEEEDEEEEEEEEE
jgi:hypothetical protein